MARLAEGAASTEAEETPEGRADPQKKPRSAFVQSFIRYRKWIILAALVGQNSGTALLAGFARDQGAAYSPAAISLAQELCKGPLVMLLIMLFGGRLRELRSTLREAADLRGLSQLLVPSICYAAQNVLYFVALANLNPAVYQLFSQSKTIFTAVFMVTLLGKQLLPRQWSALVMLACGVGAVQVSQSGAAGAAASGSILLGTAAVIASSVLSGFANVWFERIVKRPNEGTLWVRQLQLNFLTAICTFAEVLRRGEAGTVLSPATYGEWTSLVWGVVLLKAVGGLLVGGTVKYADNILKSFATAVAILVTCAFAPTSLTPGFTAGLALTVASIFVYNPNIKFRRPDARGRPARGGAQG